jgi:hypothetical protein
LCFLKKRSIIISENKDLKINKKCWWLALASPALNNYNKGAIK